MKHISLFILTLFTATALARDESVTPKGLFDPTRHMRVNEVREGMKGYGLSVFKGVKIERFEVEVLSVLKNFNPQRDVILVRCSGANLEHTGSIAGMSGSPIYLKDDQGRERMVGAFAYGWPLMKDPIGGVQPVEYMLDLESVPGKGAATAPAGSGIAEERSGTATERRAVWSYRDAEMLAAVKGLPAESSNGFAPGARLGGANGDTMRLAPLATPLMTSGISPAVMEQFGGVLKTYGLVALQAGIGGGSGAEAEAAKMEPGSVLAVPLLSGDMDMTAVGTCTEVIGNHVWGFGHPFNNEGPVTLSMGSGQISAVIPNLNTSFKLGSLTKIRGALTMDEIVGIAGNLGEPPATIPIELHVIYTDGSIDKTYRFQCAVHPRFTPLISSIAVGSAMTGMRELPQYHTLDYDLNLEFANKQVVHVANRVVNTNMSEMFFAIGTPMMAASDNPFERVMVKKITGELRVTPEARQARILSVNVPRTKFRPGEIVKAYVTYRPFRAGESILPVELELPRDIEDGSYQLEISDWQKFMEDEQNAKPFRFTAESSEEVFSVLKEVAAIKRNAIYLRLVRKEDGVAIGRAALSNLPSSRRQVLLDAGRSNTTAFTSSTTKAISTDLVMEGSADFTITVDADARVETAGVKSLKPERGAPSAAPKTDDGKSNTTNKPEKAEPSGKSDSQDEK